MDVRTVTPEPRLRLLKGAREGDPVLVREAQIADERSELSQRCNDIWIGHSAVVVSLP